MGLPSMPLLPSASLSTGSRWNGCAIHSAWTCPRYVSAEGIPVRVPTGCHQLQVGLARLLDRGTSSEVTRISSFKVKRSLQSILMLICDGPAVTRDRSLFDEVREHRLAEDPYRAFVGEAFLFVRVSGVEPLSFGNQWQSKRLCCENWRAN